MFEVNAYGALRPGAPLTPLRIDRREPSDRELLIEILYCGVCHTDIHMSRGELPGLLFPLVPGHEIVGRVREVGPGVSKYAVGDVVGVGCLIDSCRSCPECQLGNEQFCDHQVMTYGRYEADGRTLANGGYSTHITVSEDFVLQIPANLEPAAAAPLLCAGTTTYAALRHWRVGDGSTVGVVGLGGLGHLAVKMASAMGAEVTVLSTSAGKRDDALALGAKDFLLTRPTDRLTRFAGRFDLLLNTVSAAIDYDAYLRLLRRDGTLVILGVPDKPITLDAFGLLRRRKSVASSPISGIQETQEMLDFCVLRSDVRYRFVVDIASLEVTGSRP